ncbi:MAG: hypothetical protein R3F14_27205 [Polyangiaceae bacterium]
MLTSGNQHVAGAVVAVRRALFASADGGELAAGVVFEVGAAVAQGALVGRSAASYSSHCSMLGAGDPAEWARCITLRLMLS